MTREGLLDLLFERFVGQHQPALLLQRNRRLLVLDQIAITFRLRPAAGLHGSAGRRILAEPDRFGIGRIDLRDLVVNLDLLVALAQLVIKPAQLVQNLGVARFLLEQRLERKHADLRPARRHRRLLQDQIGLAIVRLVLQDFLDHFHGALRVLLQLALRLHDRDRGSRDVEQRSSSRLLFGDLRAAQKLAAREKFRLLFQDPCRSEIA